MIVFIYLIIIIFFLCYNHIDRLLDHDIFRHVLNALSSGTAKTVG